MILMVSEFVCIYVTPVTLETGAQIGTCTLCIRIIAHYSDNFDIKSSLSRLLSDANICIYMSVILIVPTIAHQYYYVAKISIFS